ncbi:MAG: hypothetical protein HY707_13500 [Ignavibacteriae bacterium]|nr:hypothetical protein [Ignavibacteriota bacterium]
MESDSISFSRLFDYIKSHPEIPHKEEPSFSGFQDLYLQLVRNVPYIPGWYAWTNKFLPQEQRVIYIGQSQTRKTSSLNARLKEEFLDEFVALWASVWNPDEVVNTLDRKYRGKYTAPIKRSARKAGATHIVWFGKRGLSDQELDVVEHALIAKYNPPANKQSRTHSTSFSDLLNEAESALQSELSKLA